MLLKETLRAIARSQRDELESLDAGVERKTDVIDADVPFAVIISGVRRCGKSTLLRQLIKKRDGFYYFNFEDPRATSFEVGDFQKLNEVFKEEFGRQDYYFFDEIQNVPRWELFVRNMLDKGRRFVITGSNASMLSRELGTKLTGRHIRHELFPFTFGEFLELEKRKPNLESFEWYFKKGGFPEYLKNPRAQILQELFNDIVIRDIAVRHRIRNIKTIKEMGLYLITNTGRKFSYNSLRKMFGLGSTNSAASFVSYFEDSYLLFTVPKFSYSLKKQLVNPKKAYSIDNGLSGANSASMSEDRGRLLENLVFLGLRRRYRDIFYFEKEYECDFVVKERTRIEKAIQVCHDLNEDNKQREIGGLLEAMEELKLKEGLILTYGQEDSFKTEGKNITVLPVWKWLLER
jgi:hypothetical protein